MKKESQVSPVMLEILVVTLFLALSASVLTQLIAKAHEISVAATAESRALILAEDALERTKADPVGDGAFNEAGVRTFSTESDGLTLTCTVTRKLTDCGAYYDIAASAYDGGTLVLSLTSGRFLPAEEVAS